MPLMLNLTSKPGQRGHTHSTCIRWKASPKGARITIGNTPVTKCRAVSRSCWQQRSSYTYFTSYSVPLLSRLPLYLWAIFRIPTIWAAGIRQRQAILAIDSPTIIKHLLSATSYKINKKKVDVLYARRQQGSMKSFPVNINYMVEGNTPRQEGSDLSLALLPQSSERVNLGVLSHYKEQAPGLISSPSSNTECTVPVEKTSRSLRPQLRPHVVLVLCNVDETPN